MKNIPILICSLIWNIACGQNWVDTSYQISTEVNIIYGVSPGFAGRSDTLKLDVSYPENDTPPECGRPLMVIVHGGAWFAGDKNEGYARRLRLDFAKRGYMTASVNYRLGLFHTNQYINCNVPDWNCFNMTDTSEWYRANYRAIQDVNGAIRFLVNAAGSYQINPENIFVVGESAGGFVAMGLGFLDDSTEVLTTLIDEYPDAPAPNALYESNCIQNHGLATEISAMDLSRPALGDYGGDLNVPLEYSYHIQAVGNFFGGAFNNIFQTFGEDAPALYLYHQPCDLIVPFNKNKLLTGYNNCLTGFPTFCQNIINRPMVYGSNGIRVLIDEMVQNNIPSCDYYFDNSGNNYNCLQQAANTSLSCHAIDNYWLRTSNMAGYFAGFIDDCVVSTVEQFDGENQVKVSVYPNPVKDILFINFNQRIRQVDLKVINVIGIIEFASSYSDLKKITIDNIGALHPGLHYLVISGEHFSSTVPFIKLKK